MTRKAIKGMIVFEPKTDIRYLGRVLPEIATLIQNVQFHPKLSFWAIFKTHRDIIHYAAYFEN